MNVSFIVKIIGQWIFCIPLFIAGASMIFLPFAFSPMVPAYFLHQGWIISLAGYGLASSAVTTRRQYARYKAFSNAWSDAAGASPSFKKTRDTTHKHGWINWPVTLVMGACLIMTYYLLNATMALIQSNNGLLHIVNAARNDNAYLVAWLVWTLMFVFGIYLLYRIFNRRLAHWKAMQTQWLLIIARVATSGFFVGCVTTSPGADEFPFLVLACVVASALTFALYFPAKKKREEKTRADNATIDGRRTPEILASIVLPIPSITPRPMHVLAQLPDYCIPLLRSPTQATYPDMRPRINNGSATEHTWPVFQTLEAFAAKAKELVAYIDAKNVKALVTMTALVLVVAVALLHKRPESLPAKGDAQEIAQARPEQLISPETQAPSSASPSSQEETQAHTDEATPDTLTPEQMRLRGLDYLNGTNGVAENREIAVELFQLAAERGDAAAGSQLGMMYTAGDGGLPHSDGDAVRWYFKAAAQGDAIGQAMLGIMYENGKGGLAQSDSDAVYWYRKAAGQGQRESQNYLGLMYEAGRGGLPQSDSDAAFWYRKAADQGDDDSQTRLGNMYEQGKGGLPQSDSDAVYWYSKAASLNNAKAEALLGSMYLLGSGGISKDTDAGIELIKRAARQGEPSAVSFLQKINVSWDEQH